MTEKILQKQVEEYLDLHKVPYLHCTTFMRVKAYAKCGKCGKAVTSWKNVSIPGMKGQPDLHVWFKCGFVAMELKHGDNKLTPEQEDVKSRLESQGYRWFTVRTFDEARKHIDYYLHAEGKK